MRSSLNDAEGNRSSTRVDARVNNIGLLLIVLSCVFYVLYNTIKDTSSEIDFYGISAVLAVIVGGKFVTDRGKNENKRIESSKYETHYTHEEDEFE